MRFNFTISRAIALFGVVTALGLGAVIFTSVYALSELKVGGPLYTKIKTGNDLVADILPPPEYVIEAYLETTLALRDPASLASHRDRLAQLKKDYDERHDYWLKADYDPSIKSTFTVKSHNEVLKFWASVDRVLPALAKADMAAAEKAYAELTSAYTAHRALIDEIVKLTNDDNAATEAEATRRVSLFTTILWVVSGLVVVVVGAGILGVAFGVIHPIARMTGVMKRLAGGATDGGIPALDRKDEVGAMAEAVQVFKENALRMKTMETERAALMQSAADERKTAMQRVAEGFEQAIGKIVQSVSSASAEMKAATASLSKTAETTQKLSATVATASEQSSSSAQSAATASEQMASSISEIGRQVQESHRIAHAAVTQADQTNVRINELSESASRIGEVVKMITAVAEQTNLLALNATIEAARAGEAGRGFAVVASEVKALSAQTAKATEEITVQITQMQAATGQSVSAIKEIGKTIGQISEIASSIAAAVEEQGATTQEIARNVQHAAEGATEVAGGIADVHRGAVDTGAAAGQVRGLAMSLQTESEHLTLEVEKFLTTVRAA
jgi:methyl-accepting chemotaxis protein